MTAPNTTDSVICPWCRAAVTLTPRRQVMAKHRTLHGDICSASGHRPDLLREGMKPHRPLLMRVGSYTYAAIFTVLAGTLGILGYFGITPAGDGAKGPSAADPFLYVASEGHRLGRQQPCAGLLGLCIGQPIDLAFDAFGASEDDGFPVSVNNPDFGATVCHRWSPPRLDTVSICEVEGAISQIRVDSFSSGALSVAIPEEGKIFLGDAVDAVAQTITETLEVEPFKSTWVPGDGEAVFGFDWFLPQQAEGSPEVVLAIVGRYGSFPDSEPRPCPGPDLNYRYADILAMDVPATATSVTVRRTERLDLAAEPC